MTIKMIDGIVLLLSFSIGAILIHKELIGLKLFNKSIYILVLYAFVALMLSVTLASVLNVYLLIVITVGFVSSILVHKTYQIF